MWVDYSLQYNDIVSWTIHFMFIVQSISGFSLKIWFWKICIWIQSFSIKLFVCQKVRYFSYSVFNGQLIWSKKNNTNNRVSVWKLFNWETVSHCLEDWIANTVYFWKTFLRSGQYWVRSGQYWNWKHFFHFDKKYFSISGQLRSN